MEGAINHPVFTVLNHFRRLNLTLFLAANCIPSANVKYARKRAMARLRWTKLCTAVNSFFLWNSKSVDETKKDYRGYVEFRMCERKNKDMGKCNYTTIYFVDNIIIVRIKFQYETLGKLTICDPI